MTALAKSRSMERPEYRGHCLANKRKPPKRGGADGVLGGPNAWQGWNRSPTPRSEAWFLICPPTPDLRQLPNPFYANDVTAWNLAPALPFARYARHVLVRRRENVAHPSNSS